MQLSFAVIPLILFTNDRDKMGHFANSRGTKIVAWVVAAIILLLNLYLLYDALK
jgi:manganese transport protein